MAARRVCVFWEMVTRRSAGVEEWGLCRESGEGRCSRLGPGGGGGNGGDWEGIGRGAGQLGEILVLLGARRASVKGCAVGSSYSRRRVVHVILDKGTMVCEGTFFELSVWH